MKLSNFPALLGFTLSSGGGRGGAAHSPTSIKDTARGVVEDLRALDPENTAWRVYVLQAALAIEEHALKVHQVRAGQIEETSDD